MAEFHYDIINQWEESCGTVYIYFTTSYDAIKNQTTVTFSESSHRLHGDDGTSMDCTTHISVTATDSNNSASSKVYIEGTTNGGYQIFGGTPSPTTVTVQHSNTAGKKKVSVVAWSNYYYDWTASGEGSTTVSSGTCIPHYVLSVNAGTGSIVAVNRISSALGVIGNLPNGETIFKGDKLQITFNTSTGYGLKTHTVNGSTFTSGETHTVSEDVIVVATAELQGLIYIDNGFGWDTYQVYIDNGTGWDMYIPYIDNGSNWSICS